MSRSRPNLVFVRVGAKSLHRDWLESPGERNWDLQLSQYDDDPEIGRGGDLPLSKDKGTKWDSIYRYLANDPGLLDRYRYIAFMDDDIVFTKRDLNRYFEICEENELLLAQPSLHPDSHVCYPILLRCPFTKLRYTNFVECMATAIRSDYLRTFLPHMEPVVSGWGMDRIWTGTMPDPEFRSAVIDEISMIHTRPHATGAVYDAFDDQQISPKQEMERLLSSYDGVPDRMLAYGAMSKTGRRLNATITQALNGLSLMINAPRYRNCGRAFKSGAAMMARAVTLARYQPQPIRKILPEGA